MRLVILDGAATVGGTKIYLESQRTGLLLDFGINYKRWGLYFEEYLKPRAARGILDLLALGLTPQAGAIYRDDLFPPEYRPTLPELQVAGVLISHAHLDHCGLLGLLRTEIPIHASALSAAMMKAIQESGQLDYYSEMAYINPRLPREEDPRALGTEDWRRGSYLGRHWIIADGASDSLKAFLTAAPNPRGKRLTPQAVGEATGCIGDLNYRAFPVDHSIPGALAYAVETESGWVVYTGDLRLHGGRGELTAEFVAAARGLRPYLMIIEGTRAGVAGSRTSEAEVYENALGLVQEHAGELVLADFGPRNIERLQSFLMIAQEAGRRLLVLAKDAHLLGAIAAAAPERDLLSHPSLGIFDEVKVESRAWEERIRQRYSGKLVRLEEVHRDPGQFILAFSYWDLKHLLDLAPRGGLYIYSSSESYTEEQRIDMRRLWNWLQFLGFEVAGFYMEGNDQESSKPVFPEGLHASGHASGEDLLWMANEIQPQFLLPVHTECPEFFQQSLRGEPIEVLAAREGEEALQ